jgi:hypothetical protein
MNSIFMTAFDERECGSGGIEMALRSYPILLLFILAGLGCQRSGVETAGWDLKPPFPDARPVTAKEQLPGIYPVGSRIEDRKALGGFGPCDNVPKKLTGKQWGTKGLVSIVAFPDEPVAYFKSRGFALRIVNRSGDTIALDACDSDLVLVCEALADVGTWKAIESPPIAICGNSYHRVFLEPGEYWEFPAREYDGAIKTKLRFRLNPGNDRPVLYSEEFDGRINATQFQAVR